MPFGLSGRVISWIEKFPKLASLITAGSITFPPVRAPRTLYEALAVYEAKVTPSKSRGTYFGDVPPLKAQGAQAIDRRTFQRFRELVTDRPLSEVTREHCEDFRDSLRRAGCKSQTIRRNESPLRSFFRWCIEREYIEKSPMDRMKRMAADPKRETDMLTVDELTLLLKSAARWHRNAMYFMGLTGARRAQTCFLRLADYQPGRGRLLFRSYKGFRTKGGQEHMMPLTPALRKFLDGLVKDAVRSGRAADPDALLFVGPQGEPIRPDRLTKETTRLMRRILTRSVGASCHAFRRTAASRWAEAGASSATVATLLHHSRKTGSRVVDECYIRNSPEYLQKVVSGNRIQLPVRRKRARRG